MPDSKTQSTGPIKLKKLLEFLQSCYDKHKDNPECADNIEVEFFRGERPLVLKSIGQFGVKPDVVITLKKQKVSTT